MCPSSQPPPDKSRENLDADTSMKRGRSIDSFERRRGRVESDTDRSVAESRDEADIAKLKRRTEADGRLSGIGANVAIHLDQNEDDVRRFNERQSEDSAIKRERTDSDLAFEIERKKKEKLLTKLVGDERQVYDKKLLAEKIKNDVEALIAANLLSLEQAAHQSTKSALTTREEFIAIVSHDLRNPIGAILSSVEMLSEDLSLISIGEDTKRWIEIIKRNAETSLRLISDILDMERIVEGKIELRTATHRVDNLIADAVESHTHIALAKKIAIVNLAVDLKRSINCDRDRVAQVLSNLIGNAIKFTPANGSITINAEELETEMVFSVKDTGPGIPEDQKHRVFERFLQLGSQSRSGLGLGLYISKTIVDLHGGRIWLTSELGKGSTFWFTLPC